VLRDKRQKVIEAVANHLDNPKQNIRESAITVILNYSIIFLLKSDPEGKI
jgi:hypothetical protein